MLRTRICSSAVATDVNRTDQVGGLFFLVDGDDVNTDGRENTKRNWLLFVKWIGKWSPKYAWQLHAFPQAFTFAQQQQIDVQQIVLTTRK